MADELTRDQKTVFAIGQTPDGKPMIVIGIPQGAWEYMKDGKTHHFDFSAAGLPIQLMMFGGTDHADCMKVMNDALAAAGRTYEDARNKDFGIKDVDDAAKNAG